MADNKIKFLRGTADEYANATKDNDTIYFTTDDKKLHIGDEEILGENITIDDVLSDTSENPVQNKIIKAELDKKANKEIYSDNGISLGRKKDTAVGTGSVAFGVINSNNEASGEISFATGTEVKSSGYCSFAEGEYTVASGSCSHASGNGTIASGSNAFAGGQDSEASERCTFVYGDSLIVSRSCSAAFGHSNIANEDTLFSIGDGLGSDGQTEDRHNAFEITTTGGKLHDKDIATTDLATQSKNGLMSAADKEKLDSGIATKLNSSSYQEITIAASEWEVYAYESNGTLGSSYRCTKTLKTPMPYSNFNFEVKLSTDNPAAKLQIQNWNYIMADGRIEQTTSDGSTTAFTFYAFTTKPTIELIIAIQGVSE